ncbi:MAG TPA: YraN family protein [Burkholderiales bacterium]|nr:YraN family protein [Burkholderiales bacterium]
MTRRGLEAEELAFEYLRSQGLTAVERNYRCRLGEIDLIMRDGETLVFVEVRMRASSNFGGALESIDARKQRKLLSAARHYIGALGKIPNCRFDAVLLNGDNHIDWIPNAFGE